jgi:lysozyme
MIVRTIALALLLVIAPTQAKTKAKVPTWAIEELQDDVNASEDAKKRLRAHEGLSLTSYKDIAGIWTVGYGLTGSVNGTKVGPTTKISKEQAEALLEAKVAEFAEGVTKAVKVPLEQHQFDALVSLAYNIGMGAFLKSTLLKRLNAKDYKGAAEQFPRWKYAGGKESLGLLKRRMQEKALFLGESYPKVP